LVKLNQFLDLFLFVFVQDVGFLGTQDDFVYLLACFLLFVILFLYFFFLLQNLFLLN